jgi:tyrosyl-tRNA synthetase
MKMKLSDELAWRGFIQQKTFEDDNWLDKPKTVYFGVDPSADSLHVGNLASFMPLRHMLDHGWKVILLVGGATGMIGDPGGKSEERNLLDQKTLEHNKRAVEAQVKQLFAGQHFRLVDNYDWTKDVKLLDFLRDFGKHFGMTMLTQRDYIAQRMGEGGAGISYTEFSYTLLQGYDYWHLHDKYDCVLQYGGSDQWGNMLSGVELIRRKEGKEAHVLAGPLIVDNRTGKKFGKTEGGAVWLDANKTSVYKFYQFWLNADDGAVRHYLGYFTLLSKEEIDEIHAQFDLNRGERFAQKTLAYEVTKLVHGSEQADKVRHISEVLFGSTPFADLSAAEVAMLAEEIPVVKAGNDDLAVLLQKSGLATSLSEARRTIEANGVYINGEKTKEFTPDKFVRGHLLLRRGKNTVALVKAK